MLRRHNPPLARISNGSLTYLVPISTGLAQSVARRPGGLCRSPTSRSICPPSMRRPSASRHHMPSSSWTGFTSGKGQRDGRYQSSRLVIEPQWERARTWPGSGRYVQIRWQSSRRISGTLSAINSLSSPVLESFLYRPTCSGDGDQFGRARLPSLGSAAAMASSARSSGPEHGASRRRKRMMPSGWAP